MLCAWVDRVYEREAIDSSTPMPFQTWLHERCHILLNAGGSTQASVRALSSPPSRKACSFRSMSSFGSHFRVEVEEGGVQHVTFESGVAELCACTSLLDTTDNSVVVELLRVGILKDILVLNYGNLDIVLMVVSWVPADTELQPTLHQDAHGFWLANMAARPRDTTEPYPLPALASQVRCNCPIDGFFHVVINEGMPCNILNMNNPMCTGLSIVS